jgi:hypothetical protein
VLDPFLARVVARVLVDLTMSGAVILTEHPVLRIEKVRHAELGAVLGENDAVHFGPAQT